MASCSPRRWLAGLLGTWIVVAAAQSSASGADDQKWLDAIPPELRPMPAALPDERNAFVLWRDRSPSVQPPNEPERKDGESLCPEDAPFPDGPAGDSLRSWLAQCEPLLALLDEGLQRGEYRPIFHRDGDEVGRVLKCLRGFTRAGELRAKLAFREARSDDAAAEVEGLVRLSHLLEMGYLLDCNFAAFAWRQATNVALWLTTARELPERSYETLIAAIGATSERDALASVLRQEFLCYSVPYIAGLSEEANVPGLARTIREAFDEPGRELAGRRMAVAAILEGHSRPFDAEETMHLLGEKVLLLGA